MTALTLIPEFYVLRGEGQVRARHALRLGIEQGGSDVIGLQARIFTKDIAFRDALGQHAHDELYRDASSPYNWLTNHDLRIYADTLPKLFVHRLLCAPLTV